MDVASFSEEEGLALVNLTRVCMRLIDNLVLSSLSMTDIAQFEFQRYRANENINGLTEDKLVRKLKAYLEQNYGQSADLTVDMIRTVVTSG